MLRLLFSSLMALVVSCLALDCLFPADLERYIAVFSDGSVLEGNQLQNWHDARSKPVLEGTSFDNPANPLRWLRDRSLRGKAYKFSSGSYVEFTGGDRLPGKVVSASFNDYGGAASHLLVETEGQFARPGRIARKHVHILASKVRRVVWDRLDRRPLTPGVAYLRNGQALNFRRLRWGPGSVSILLSDGVRELAFAQIAEIHPVDTAPWETYYDELAVLDPNLEGRLFRLETVDGLIATSSRSRFQALAFSSHEEQERLGRIRQSLQGQLANFERQNKESLKRIDDLQKKLDEELKKQAEAAAPGGRDEEKTRAATERFLSQMEKRLKRRLETHDRQTRTLENNRLRQLKKVPEEARKVEIAAFRKDRQRQREQIEKQIAEEARRTKNQREEQDRRKIDRVRGLKRDNLKRLRKSKTADELLRRIDEYNNWRFAMERIEQKVEMIKGGGGGPDSWQHMVQPAWSLDPIWVPFNQIHTYMFFKPEEVPLSRFAPDEYSERHYLAKPAGWRVDRNTRNAFLSSAAREYGWGYSVHAYNEMHFDLPSLASGFRSRIGLDRQVGDGGCVVGRVFFGTRDSSPLYQSPFLVGSWQAADTGDLVFPAAKEGRRRLILQADTAHDQGVSSVDPFDIRDMVDWLEPVLRLDRQRLVKVVKDRIHRNVPAWKDWSPVLGKGSICRWQIPFEDRGEGKFFPALSLQGEPIALSRQVPAAPWRKWLQVDMSEVNALRPDSSILSVRVDGRELKPVALPRRQPWQVGSIPLVYDLGINKDSSINVEVTQKPREAVFCWRKLEISRALPAVYGLATLLEEAGGKDLQLTQAVARVLKSVRLNFDEKKTALELFRMGAEINYRKSSPIATIKLIGSKDLWKVTSSHSQPGQFAVGNAVDGNPATRWTSQASQHPGMWFQVELPTPTAIGGVRLITHGTKDHPVSYDVRASMDGVRWSGSMAKGLGSSPVTETVLGPVDAKFIRIQQTGKTTLWWSIHEIDILEPATSDVISSVLLGEKWRGGDESFALLKRIPTLSVIHFSGPVRNSPDARADLQASVGSIHFEEHECIPSHSGTPMCSFNMINKTGKNLTVTWVGFDSKPVGYPDLAAGESSIRASYVGHRWEAQIDGRRVGFYVVEPGLDWVVTDGK